MVLLKGYDERGFVWYVSLFMLVHLITFLIVSTNFHVLIVLTYINLLSW